MKARHCVRVDIISRLGGPSPRGGWDWDWDSSKCQLMAKAEEVEGADAACSTQIKLNLTKHALNGYYLLASTFNFNKSSRTVGSKLGKWVQGRGGAGRGPWYLVLVNCCWGPPVTNFDYETWQLFSLVVFCCCRRWPPQDNPKGVVNFCTS